MIFLDFTIKHGDSTMYHSTRFSCSILNTVTFHLLIRAHFITYDILLVSGDSKWL